MKIPTPSIVLTAASLVLSAGHRADAAASSSSSSSAAETTAAAAVAEKHRKLPHLLQSKEERQRIIAERNLKIDFFDDDEDECYHPETDTYDRCDLDRFPKCDNDELICYNRTNRREKFYQDWHPYYYIEYHRILCYPASWEGFGGCSSCSPGRYCKKEGRCILDEGTYDCPDWR